MVLASLLGYSHELPVIKVGELVVRFKTPMQYMHYQFKTLQVFISLGLAKITIEDIIAVHQSSDSFLFSLLCFPLTQMLTLPR